MGREMRQFRFGGVRCSQRSQGERSLNGPPRAHCAHCRGSCLARKHASRPESAEERMNERRNRAGYKRTLDNHATMKRGLFLGSSPLLAWKMFLHCCASAEIRVVEREGKRVLINGHREDYEDLSPILCKSGQSEGR